MTEMNDHSSRAHALLSASSAHRWLACPPSAVAAEAYPSQDTEFTREGTLAHEVAEYTVRTNSAVHFDLDAYLGEHHGCNQEMIDCAKAYADYIDELKATDDAVVLLEQRVDFSPWVPDGFGTADCIIIQGDSMIIIDYKYGAGVKVSAENNPQMKLYGLGALNDYGIAYDVKRVHLYIYQPRMNNISLYTISTEELLKWGETVVKPIAQKAAKGKGTHQAGEHCRFCPHAGKCRTLTKTCTEYVTTHGMKAAVPVLADWEVAEVLRMEPLVSLWLKRVKEQALSTMMSGGSVPGYKVVEGRGSRAWADELEVAAELDKNGIAREDYTKTEVLSVAQMEKALGKKKVAELLSGHILKQPGAPTVAPETDKRPAYNPADEFDKLDG